MDLLALCVALATAASTTTPAIVAVAQRDNAVFEAALQAYSASFEKSNGTAARRLIFEESALVLKDDFLGAGQRVPGPLLKALLDRNSAPRRLEGFRPTPPHQLATAALLGRSLVPPPAGAVRPRYYDWERLRADFPAFQGILEFAFPVYSDDGMESLVYLWTGCGGLCADGTLYRLRLEGGTWRVVDSLLLWIS
jgi:hypothetical protein